MNWYWTVRIYRLDGHYAHGWVKTDRTLDAINTIQDFYQSLTSCKMLLEGMSEQQPSSIPNIADAYWSLWKEYGHG